MTLVQRILVASFLLEPVAFAGDPDEPFKAFQTKMPTVSRAIDFDGVRSGMTLRELVARLGPGYVPERSGTGIIHWRSEDGRSFALGPSSDPDVVVAVSVTDVIVAHQEARRWEKLRAIGADGQPIHVPCLKDHGPWRCFLKPGVSPVKISEATFDRGLVAGTLGELVETLGPGELRDPSGGLAWTCEDGRALVAYPRKYAADARIAVDTLDAEVGRMFVEGRAFEPIAATPPERRSADVWDQLRPEMTFGEIVALLGLGEASGTSGVRWVSDDGRLLLAWPRAWRKSERLVFVVWRRGDPRRLDEIALESTKPEQAAPWRPFNLRLPSEEPFTVEAAAFDKALASKTLGELVETLGFGGWNVDDPAAGCCWRCDDGRTLRLHGSFFSKDRAVSTDRAVSGACLLVVE